MKIIKKWIPCHIQGILTVCIYTKDLIFHGASVCKENRDWLKEKIATSVLDFSFFKVSFISNQRYPCHPHWYDHQRKKMNNALLSSILGYSNICCFFLVQHHWIIILLDS